MVDQAEIHRKSLSNKVEERREAVEQLRENFPFLPDKTQAWADLLRLILDEFPMVQHGAGEALGTAFSHVLDKAQAWADLLWLIQDEFIIAMSTEKGPKTLFSVFLQVGVGEALGTAFPHVPDKEQAWDDLHWLTQDEDCFTRQAAAYSLSKAFPHVSDKEQAWADLIRLTQDEDDELRLEATYSLGTAFPHIPDKAQAWDDLHPLTQDEDCYVRSSASEVLGTAFPYFPDKTQAWADLHQLTNDEDSGVRVFANHSLGRASIFRATVAEREEEFRKELEKALEFFERASTEVTDINPSNFCLPFYRSFYTITFKKQESEAEVQKYLAEAKDATKGSKSKEQLLEAVENLANALTEAQRLQKANLDTIKRNLNAYRQYCDRAADLITAAEEETPGAARVLRCGLPIIDERIKEIIREIQEKAREIGEVTQDTPLEELGQKTTRYAQELPIRDPLALTVALSNMSSIARDWCEYIPGDKKIYACEQLKNLPNMEISEQGATLAGVFEYINKNIRIPRIQTVHISAAQQEIVRIAVVQLCFELTESFPFAVKNKNEVKAKIFSALDIASVEGANIVCLPEFCLCEEGISKIKEKYPDMIVIGGSFYKDGKNICPVIMESNVEVPPQPKITPSASEDSGIMESRMIPGDGVNRYETPFGRFVILICRDLDNLVHYFRNMTDIDIIFCPAFNSANERFHKEADVHIEKIPSYILIANAGLYGGTSIFGRLNLRIPCGLPQGCSSSICYMAIDTLRLAAGFFIRNYFSALVDGGCKDAGDLTYKLCEVKKGKEEVIIADFNLIHKSIQVPTPSDPNEEIRSVENIKKIPIQLKQRIKK